VSATNRGAVRDHLDRYYTPDALADAIVRHVVVPRVPMEPRVVEPSVGGGAFVRAVRAHLRGAHVTGYDVDPHAAGLGLCDRRRVADWLTSTPDLRTFLVVGNPPYTDAEAHVFTALHTAPVVVMLLRQGFGSGGARARGVWRRYPLAAEYVLAERPSFDGRGTDACDYSVFVWDDLHTGPATRHLMSWAPYRGQPPVGLVW
jgi:hypothetical protein